MSCLAALLLQVLVASDDTVLEATTILQQTANSSTLLTPNCNA